MRRPTPGGAHRDTAELSAYPHDTFKVRKWEGTSADADGSDKRFKAAPLDSDVITSTIAEQSDEWHTIMLDLDVPARLVPSTTEGHAHLYIDVPVQWATLVPLLDALAAAGVIELGYAEASKARGCTSLRLPWVKKDAPVEQGEAPF